MIGGQIKILIEKSFFSLGQYQKPEYTGVDRGASKYVSYAFENNQHVFTVEQGTRFYLKLNLSANPPPNSRDLYENGRALPPAVPGLAQRVINLNNDSINIQSVQAADAANYTISCSNSMGEAQFSFRLKVVGKCKTIVVYSVGLNMIISLSTIATDAYSQPRAFDLRDQHYNP